MSKHLFLVICFSIERTLGEEVYDSMLFNSKTSFRGGKLGMVKVVKKATIFCTFLVILFIVSLFAGTSFAVDTVVLPYQTTGSWVDIECEICSDEIYEYCEQNDNWVYFDNMLYGAGSTNGSRKRVFHVEFTMNLCVSCSMTHGIRLKIKLEKLYKKELEKVRKKEEKHRKINEKHKILKEREEIRKQLDNLNTKQLELERRLNK